MPSVKCFISDCVETLNLSLGEDLGLVSTNLKKKHNLPQSSKLICCLEPQKFGHYFRIISKLPLTKIPTHLYFYDIPDSQFRKKFKNVIVYDQTEDCPVLQLVIEMNSTINDLANIYKIMKGYLSESDVSFTNNSRGDINQLDSKTKIVQFSESEPQFYAKLKIVIVNCFCRGVPLGKVSVPLNYFSLTAKQIIQRCKDSLPLTFQSQNLSSSIVQFEMNNMILPEYQIIRPALDSLVIIRIDWRQRQTISYYSAPSQVYIDQSKISIRKINSLCRQHISQNQKQTSPDNQIVCKSNNQCSIQNLIVFKETKKSLREAFNIADELQQDTVIKNIIFLHMRAVLD